MKTLSDVAWARLSVEHETLYEYASPVEQAQRLLAEALVLRVAPPVRGDEVEPAVSVKIAPGRSRESAGIGHDAHLPRRFKQCSLAAWCNSGDPQEDHPGR